MGGILPLTKIAGGLLLAASVLFSTPVSARNIYLNGTDISSARNQELKNVRVIINEHGDVFLIAPHYQVNLQDSYVPLSKYMQGVHSPKHKKPSMLSKDQAKAMTMGAGKPVHKDPGEAPEAGEQRDLAEKPGSKSQEE